MAPDRWVLEACPPTGGGVPLYHKYRWVCERTERQNPGNSRVGRASRRAFSIKYLVQQQQLVEIIRYKRIYR